MDSMDRRKSQEDRGQAGLKNHFCCIIRRGPTIGGGFRASNFKNRLASGSQAS
jgi:hypothetical protein